MNLPERYVPLVQMACEGEERYAALVDLILDGNPAYRNAVPFLTDAQNPTLLQQRLLSLPGSVDPKIICEPSSPATTINAASLQPTLSPSGAVLCVDPRAVFPARLLSLHSCRRLLIAESESAAIEVILDSQIDSSLTVVGLPDAVSMRMLRSISERTLRGPTGIITAHSVLDLTQVVAWQLLSSQAVSGNKHLLVTSNLQLVDDYGSAETICDYATEFEAAKVDSVPLDFFGFGGRGASVHAEIGERHLLCGKRKTVQRKPCKVYSCEISEHCVQDPDGTKERIPIDTIDTKFLFSLSCRGISLGDSEQSIGLNLGLGALEAGTLGYLSMIRRAGGFEHYLVAASCAIRSGYSFGEVAMLTNRLSSASFLSGPSYVLLGNPDRRLAPPPIIGSPQVAICTGGTGATLAFTASDSTLYWYPIGTLTPPSTCSDRTLVVECVSTDDNDDSHPIVCEVHDLAGSLFLLVCLPRSTPGMEVVVECSWESSLSTIVSDLAARVGANIETLRCISGGIPPKPYARPGQTAMKSDMEALLSNWYSLQSSMASLTEELGLKQSMSAAHRQAVLDQIERYRARVSAFELEAMKNFAEWDVPQYFPSLYIRSLKVESEESTEDRCPTCGMDLDATVSGSVFHPGAKRLTLHCQRCLLIADRPLGGPEVRIKVPSNLRPNEELLVEIVASNPGRLRTKLVGALRCYNGLKTGALAPSGHEVISVEIDPGSTVHTRIRTKPSGNSLPGNHMVSFMYFADLGIGFSCAYTHLDNPTHNNPSLVAARPLPETGR